jgi:hypothetical protein
MKVLFLIFSLVIFLNFSDIQVCKIILVKIHDKHLILSSIIKYIKVREFCI